MATYIDKEKFLEEISNNVYLLHHDDLSDYGLFENEIKEIADKCTVENN